MSTTIWVLAGYGDGTTLCQSFSAAWHALALSPSNIEFKPLTVNPLSDPDDVVLCYVIPDRAGAKHVAGSNLCYWPDLLGKMCRNGHRGPFVVLSFQEAHLHAANGHTHETSTIVLRTISGEIPGFAPIRDTYIRLPASLEEIVTAVRDSYVWKGRLRAISDDAAILSWEAHGIENARVADHQMVGFEAVLRFLRGAQLSWRIHPDDGRQIVEHIRKMVVSDDPRLSPAVRNRFKAAYKSQIKRWDTYEEAITASNRSVQQWTEYRLPYRLLLIDDDHECLGWRMLLQVLLAPDGYEVVADDGTGYESYITDRLCPVDLVMLDMDLPADTKDRTPIKFRGLQILDTLRTLATDLPIIMFTGHERLALERHKSELGLAGYLVKSEEAELQNPRACYSRLRAACRGALDYRYRAVLKKLFDRLRLLDYSLYTATYARASQAIYELDDATSACHCAGLALESGLRLKLSSEQDMGTNSAELASRISADMSNWPSVAVKLRNVASHAELGAEMLEPLDAHLSVSLMIVLLYRLAGQELSSADSDLARRLLYQSLLLCATSIENVAANHESLLRLTELHAPLTDVITILQSNAVRLQEVSFAETCTALYSLTSHIFRVATGNTLSDMWGRNGDRLRREWTSYNQFTHLATPREGYEHMVHVVFAYLSPGCGVPASYGPCVELDRACLTAIMLTRIIDWCVRRVIALPNPKSVDGRNTKNITDFEDILNDVVTGPAITRAALLELGDNLLITMSDDNLISPVRSTLRHLVNEDRALVTKHEHSLQKFRLELQLHQSYSHDAREELWKAQSTRDTIEQSLINLQLLGGGKAAKVVELGKRKGDAIVAIAEHQVTVNSLSKRIIEIEDRIREHEHTLRTLIARLSCREGLLATRVPDSSLAPAQLMDWVAEEFAPNTGPEIALVRRCLNDWIWTDLILDIPDLFKRLDIIWHRRGINAERSTKESAR